MSVYGPLTIQAAAHWERAYLAAVPDIPRLAEHFGLAVAERSRLQDALEVHRERGRGRRRHTAKHQNEGADLRHRLKGAEAAEAAARGALLKGQREVEAVLARAARLRALDMGRCDLAVASAADLEARIALQARELAALRQWQGSDGEASPSRPLSALLRGGPGDEASSATATDLGPQQGLRGDQATGGDSTSPS